MIEIKSPARITLYLEIGKLIDGYHELKVIKQKISLYDNITIKKSKELNIICNPLIKSSENIVYDAVTALKNKYNIKENVEIEIEKRIPIGAGLAGGSSNVAYALKGLNELWSLKLTIEDMVNLVYEEKIGRDIPFFFYEGTAYDTETDSKKIKLLKNVPKMYVILAKPDLKILSADAYRIYDELNKNQNKTGNLEGMLDSIKRGDYSEIVKNLHNDFELILEKEEYRPIRGMLQKLPSSCLTGSGSCVFGLYEDRKEAEKIRKKLNGNNTFVYLAETL